MRHGRGRVDSVVVVGAGLGGLRAALQLAGSGRTVTVVERADRPGGLARGQTVDGYHFDSGPTVLTMPELIDDAFAAVGESSPLKLVRLDPAYEARFADGSTIRVHTDPGAMADEIAATCAPANVDGYRRLVTRLRALYDCEMPAFIGRNLDSPADLSARAALRVIRLGGLRRWSALVGSFLPDQRLRRIFSFQSLYAGVAPQRALGIYAVIAYMDCVAGIYYPCGGMSALGIALAAAAEVHGVTFRYGTAVTGLTRAAEGITGVLTADGEHIGADAVVWNGDPGRAATLLGRRPQRRSYAPSCVLWLAGTPRSPVTAHHTISFGAAWRRTFDEIVDAGRPMSDPSLLVSAPSRTDSSLAPSGGHTHYTLFPAPNLSRPASWLDGYHDSMHRTLDARGLGDCVADPAVETVITPRDWAAAGQPFGTPFGPDHGWRQTGPFRASTQDRRVPNLLYCGAAVQPGVGVPTVLLSGRLAAERITGRPR
jgi:phytoene desaturase